MKQFFVTKIGIQDLVPIIYATSAITIAAGATILYAFYGMTGILFPVITSLIFAVAIWFNRRY